MKQEETILDRIIFRNITNSTAIWKIKWLNMTYKYENTDLAITELLEVLQIILLDLVSAPLHVENGRGSQLVANGNREVARELL